MQITIDFVNKNGVARQRSATFGTAAVDKACRILGYPTQVANQQAQRDLELKQAEFFALEANDPQRAVIAEQIKTLQTLASTPIDNPQGKEVFLVGQIREFLLQILMDPAVVNQAATTAHTAAIQSEKTAAETDIGFQQ